MSDSAGANLSSTSLQVLSWYLRRISAFFTRSFNLGFGAFVLYAISVTAAVFSLRITILEIEADQTYVAELMRAEIQPQSEVSRSTIVSMILAKLEDPAAGQYLYCKERTEGDCGIGVRIWTDTQKLLDAVEHAAQENGTGQTVVSEVYGSKGEISLPELQRNIEARKPNGPAVTLPTIDACGDEDLNQQRAFAFLMAKPFCQGTPASATVEVLPQQSADVVTDENASTNWARTRDYRLWRAPLDAELFDAVMRLSARSLPLPQEKTSSEPELVAAYFITIDNAIRYWTRQGSVAPKDLPPFREWAARPYIYDLLKKVDTVGPSSTSAYVDFAGHGIVSTTCRPLTVQSALLPTPISSMMKASADSARLPALPPRVAVGFLCFDYSLPVKGLCALADHINRGPIATAAVLEFPDLRSDLCSLSQNKASPAWITDSRVINAVKLARKNFDSDPTYKRDVLALDPYGQGDSSTVFLMNAGGTSPQREHAILLRITGIGAMGPRPMWWILAVVSGMIAIGTFVVGAQASKDIALRERQLGRLRSLQIAVIQTTGESGGERISAANDRAEELLDCTLPNFGLDDKESRNFSDLLDVNSILALPPEEIAAQTSPSVIQNIGLLRRGSLARIRIERQEGRTTAYFIRLRSDRMLTTADRPWSNKWLKVIAGPIFEPPMRSFTGLSRRRRWTDSHGDTFGVLELVPKEWDKLLDGVVLTAPAAREST